MIAGLALTSFAVLLHLLFMLNAAALWRDEANSVFIATLPTIADLWQLLEYDSFPILHFLAIRVWAMIAGSEDGALRGFGFLVGTGLLGIIWFQARTVGVRAPLVALLLIAMNPVFILATDSLRANGLAAIATLLAFAFTWRTVNNPKTANLCWTTVAVLCCVQSLYQGAFIVLALACGALPAAFRVGGAKRAALVSLPFSVAVISLLPYLEKIGRAWSWGEAAMVPAGNRVLLPGFLDAVTAPVAWFGLMWVAAAAFGYYGALRWLRQTSVETPHKEPGLLVYCAGILIAAAAALTFFMTKLVGFNPQFWHFVPFLVPMVAALEPLIGMALHAGRRHSMLAIATVLIGAAILAPSIRLVSERMTGIDLVAAAIAREALPQDLVVVTPWYFGVSFSRYYGGKTAWMTFPSLQDNSVHRYDLLKARMGSPDAVARDVERIAATLKAGGRIFLAGSVFSEVPEKLPPPLPLPPHPVTGWSSSPYVDQWEKMLLRSLADHARFANTVDLSTAQQINPLEIPQLVVFHGWRE